MKFRYYMEKAGVPIPPRKKSLLERLFTARDFERQEIEWKVDPTRDDCLVKYIDGWDAEDIIHTILGGRENGVIITRTAIVLWSLDDKYVKVLLKE